MAFTVQRGTNISHWLSQTSMRGEGRRAWFTQEDVQRIAGMGFDHVRIPIDEVQMWDEAGEEDEEAFALLDGALDWCAEAGLRVIVDLHILRSHHFLDLSTPALYTDSTEAERFVSLWRSLSGRFGSRPVGQVAYELLNEAVARDPEDWNRVAMMAFSAVRELEPERTIVLGSNDFSTPGTFDQLAVPEDEHCMLTFHFYSPHLVTHYKAPWDPNGVYTGPIHYPGAPIAAEDLAALDKSVLDVVVPLNEPYDRDAMVADIRKPLEVRQETGYPLYCGEFGCYRETPQPLQVAWYRDIMQTFREHEIAWANWDYKGGFGLITPDGRDTGILAILMEQ